MHIPKQVLTAPFKTVSKTGVIMGAWPTLEQAQQHAFRLNASKSAIDRMNAPYGVRAEGN